MARSNLYCKVRSNTPDDIEPMRAFFNSPVHIHQHLDWQTPNERLSTSPFWIAEKNNTFIATLCIPITNDELSWIEIFAAKKNVSLSPVWQALFTAFSEDCRKKHPDLRVFSLAYYPWYQKLLENSGFVPAYEIVTLETDGLYLPSTRLLPSNLTLQPITMDNFPLVHQLDKRSFDLPWQMTESALRKAFQSSLYATVILDDNQAIGYQMSTEGENSLHLARIAVHPNLQSKGIGGFLIHDLLSYMKRFHYHNLSVNTQSNNQSSLALYRKMGFYKTGTNIPVFVYNMQEE